MQGNSLRQSLVEKESFIMCLLTARLWMLLILEEKQKIMFIASKGEDLMSISNYRLEVHYQWTKTNSDANLDHIADKLAGKRNWASGLCFGERDLSYDFHTIEQAKKAYQ